MAEEGKATPDQPGESAQELALLIDAASDYAIYMLDPAGHVTIWNRGSTSNPAAVSMTPRTKSAARPAICRPITVCRAPRATAS